MADKYYEPRELAQQLRDQLLFQDLGSIPIIHMETRNCL